MNAIVVNLPLYNASWIFETERFLSYFPQSLIGTTVDLTGENEIDITQPFVTKDVMDVIWNIVEYDRILDFNTSITQNLMRSGDYLNIDMLIMIADPKWRNMTKKYPNVNILNEADMKEYGDRMFVDAIIDNYELFIDYLLNNGADPTQYISQLVPTSEEGEMMTYDMNYKGRGVGHKMDAITYASYYGYLPLVERLLLDERVDPTRKEIVWSAIGWASRQGHLAVLQRLFTHSKVTIYQKDEALLASSSSGHLGIVNWILQDSEVDPSSNFNSPLQLASMAGHLDVVERLLEDPRVDPSFDRNWILVNTIRTDKYDIVERLLQDPRVVMTGLGNAINQAISHERPDILELLRKVNDISIDKMAPT